MKERPILFSGAMIRAILAGQKTQTRRVVKPQPHIDTMGNFCWDGWNFGQDFNGPHIQAIASPIPSSKTGRVHCPYGKPGDRLWVREAWRLPRIFNAPTCCLFTHDLALHAADGRNNPACTHQNTLLMPRWASRILLEIVSVRVERLQSISDDDLSAEGIQEIIDAGVDHDGWPRDAFRSLWDGIYGEGHWATNPWVWAVEFKRIEATP